jgi:hypothetical protein
MAVMVADDGRSASAPWIVAQLTLRGSLTERSGAPSRDTYEHCGDAKCHGSHANEKRRSLISAGTGSGGVQLDARCGARPCRTGTLEGHKLQPGEHNEITFEFARIKAMPRGEDSKRKRMSEQREQPALTERKSAARRGQFAVTGDRAPPDRIGFVLHVPFRSIVIAIRTAAWTSLAL